jgi:hypothetical protein
MNNLYKTNIEGYYKDPKTNMVINLSNEYELIKAQRKKDKEIDIVKSDINNLRNDILEIKELLTAIARNMKND